MKKLQSIELFSGAGGLALGLHEAGFEHRALFEWNAAAVDARLHNQRIGYPSLQGGDIYLAHVREIDFTRHRGIGAAPHGCSPEANRNPSLAV